MKDLKVEIHLLQNFPPSCLNRDDANVPKQCDFGGVARARISSQCEKRTIREFFRQSGSVPVGERTRKLKDELRRKLKWDAADTARNPAIDLFLSTFYSGMDKDGERTTVLAFVSQAEIDEAANCIRDHEAKLLEAAAAASAAAAKVKQGDSPAAQKKKKPNFLAGDIVKAIRERLKGARLSADIALFGRMLAENPDFNCDAACQVAHAIATHELNPETDFFTAVDDLNKADTGAGMMGIANFNSACFYRYAAIDRSLLIANLAGDANLADRAIKCFLEASVCAIPSARKNSTAPACPPSFGLFVVRSSGVPVSLANAFAAPVRNADDLIAASVRSLDRHYAKVAQVFESFEDADAFVFHTVDATDAPALAAFDQGSAREAITAAMTSIKTRS